MTLKLTHDQLESLFNLFTSLVLPDEPETVEDRLVAVMMVKIYKKLRNKLEGNRRAGYCLALNTEEALAYLSYFQNRALPASWQYEQNIIQLHINEIDRQHG